MPISAKPCHQLWPLAPRVHVAVIESDLVFLNVTADTYLCLPGGTASVSLHEEFDALVVDDAGIAASLVDAGLLASRDPNFIAAIRTKAPEPTSSLVKSNTAGLAWRHLPPMTHSLADLLLRYRGRAFCGLLQLMENREPGPGRQSPTPELREVVADFHRWVPYAPISGKCLLRSFTLLRLLQRHGFDAQWVFGVATWPFRAHCWLQSGEVALDDDVDRLAAFTPILVV